MDLFIAGCQGVGLALAVGTFLGAAAAAAGARDSGAGAVLAVAAMLGAFLCGASLTPEDHPAWPGWIVGAPVAALGFVVARDVCEGARQRAGSAGIGAAGLIGLYGLCLAGVALTPASPLCLIALAVTVWLWFSRRRRAASKHAGLRSLR